MIGQFRALVSLRNRDENFSGFRSRSALSVEEKNIAPAGNRAPGF
jgi:hypothetical protein